MINSSSKKYKQPYKVELTNVVEISLSHRHILARTKDNKVYSWGENEENECGFDKLDSLEKPKLI